MTPVNPHARTTHAECVATLADIEQRRRALAAAEAGLLAAVRSIAGAR